MLNRLPSSPQEFFLSASPLVSVVVPAYNAEKYICQALDSILAQTYPNLEIIVVDDGSTDATSDLIRRYEPKVRYVYQPNSGGCSKPRNEGIKLSRGALIVVFDADDIMLSDRIATQAQFLCTHPTVGMVIVNYQNFRDGTLERRTHFETCPELSRLLHGAQSDELILEPDAATTLLLTENFAIAGNVMYRRPVWDVTGPYDENLRASEDFEFHYRIASRFPIATLNRVGFHRRLHDSNMTRNSVNIFVSKIESRQKILRTETDKHRRKLLRRMIGDLHIGLAYFYCGRDNRRGLINALSSVRYKSPLNLFFVKTTVKTLLSAARLLPARPK